MTSFPEWIPRWIPNDSMNVIFGGIRNTKTWSNSSANVLSQCGLET